MEGALDLSSTKASFKTGEMLPENNAITWHFNCSIEFWLIAYLNVMGLLEP